MIRSIIMIGLVLAETTPLSAAEPNTMGVWTIEQNRNSKTNAVITSAHVIGDDVRIDYGCNDGHGAPTMLIITSKNNLGGVIGAAFRPVTFRADGGHPLYVNLRYDDSTVTTRYDNTLRLVKAVLDGGRSLTVRLVTQLGDPIDASFDITGADNALAFVDKACESIPAVRR